MRIKPGEVVLTGTKYLNCSVCGKGLNRTKRFTTLLKTGETREQALSALLKSETAWRQEGDTCAKCRKGKP